MATQKNGIFLCFLVLLVQVRILDCVEVYFLAEYHGKCLIDGAFGMLAWNALLCSSRRCLFAHSVCCRHA